MKILLRNWKDSHYVWQDATWIRGRFFIDDIEIYHTNILAIKSDEDIAKNYVMCAHCGTMVKNDPESIEAHFAEMEAKRDCFKCQNMRERAQTQEILSFKKKDDGTYDLVKNVNAYLVCKVDYYNAPEINSDRAKQICQYYQCRRRGTQKINDIFFNYPGIFDKNITVDKLIEGKYVFSQYADCYFEYDLKCRNTVKACVNEAGVVDHFIIKSKGYTYRAYYSAKYDKLFWGDGCFYTESMPYHMTENKLEMAMKRIAALYKED